MYVICLKFDDGGFVYFNEFVNDVAIWGIKLKDAIIYDDLVSAKWFAKRAYERSIKTNLNVKLCIQEINLTEITF